MKQIIKLMLVGSFIIFTAATSWAHCEIPCGIYDDKARIAEIHEHITTISKSIASIKELSAEGDKNYNQIVRWVTNKDKHAEELQHIVYQYFMTQRIKPQDPENAGAYAKYTAELTLLHEMLVYAMKSKQSLDMANPDKLHKLTEQFDMLYFADHHKGSMKGSMKEGSNK